MRPDIQEGYDRSKSVNAKGDVLIDFIKHLIEWLILVIPAMLVAGTMAFLLRGWLQGSALRFFSAWIGGVITIGALASILVFGFSKVLDNRIATCNTGPDYYLCAQNIHIIGYPILIGLIAFGVFLIVPMLWGIWRAGRRLLLRRVPSSGEVR